MGVGEFAFHCGRDLGGSEYERHHELDTLVSVGVYLLF
jgi:hypothetical protein